MLAGTNPQMAEACDRCHSEFMIGAGFCHTCGSRRAVEPTVLPSDANVAATTFWISGAVWLRDTLAWAQEAWASIRFPAWMQYLHFHEIKRWIGLPTAALVAFMVGLGCVAGAIGVGLFFKASNLGEFQAIQLWRIEWLLAATAAFVAGILLKKPSDE